jgi:hypothetical protein
MNKVKTIVEYWKYFGFKALMVKIFEKFRVVIRYWRSYGLWSLIGRVYYEFSKKNSALVDQDRQLSEVNNLEKLVSQRFSAIQPLRCFYVQGSGRRLNLVTDSINSGSLFGGVATAITFSALLADRWDCDLRIVTRTEPALKKNFQEITELTGSHWNKNIEFAFMPSSNPNTELSVRDDDVFLTTSWWTTKSVMGAICEEKIIYLLQEDERAFYPYGDDHLRCTDTLKNPNLKFVINTKLLYEHLVSDGFENIRANGLWFEPAWPTNIFFHENKQRQKKNFFFYARPNNMRNLFYLGLEVIDSAISKGILDINEWEIYFVGKDIPKLDITSSYSPKLIQNVNLTEYSALVRKMDLGLCLMYTPHPSYPPLDLAASGAVVVTNKYGNKRNLGNYSRNILCQDLSVDDLVRGIKEGINLALNHDIRSNNFRENNILHDWSVSFKDVLSQLEGWPSNVSN